jgi:hypothetical protein
VINAINVWTDGEFPKQMISRQVLFSVWAGDARYAQSRRIIEMLSDDDKVCVGMGRTASRMGCQHLGYWFRIAFVTRKWVFLLLQPFERGKKGVLVGHADPIQWALRSKLNGLPSLVRHLALDQ